MRKTIPKFPRNAVKSPVERYPKDPDGGNPGLNNSVSAFAGMKAQMGRILELE